MARLYRPPVPLSVKCAVAFRQLLSHGYVWDARDPERRLGRRLAGAMIALSQVLGCEVSDLRLDHDPPLGARPKRGEGKQTVYDPPANDPEHLLYRPHGPEFDGSHLIKTNVRGDHGQHPDRVLIKKMRRIERGPRPKRQPRFKTTAPKRKWPSRPFPKRSKRK